MAPTTVLFFPDRNADSPLWMLDRRPFDLVELPLSDELRRLLMHWADVAAPMEAGDDDLDHVLEFGRMLCRRTADELGAAFDVRWSWEERI